MFDFTGKVVLVTGAGRGIGRATALAFAAHGAYVAANDVTPVNLDETIAQMLAAGGQGQSCVFDIAKKMPVQAMIDQVIQRQGRIDILVNSAGVQPKIPLLDMDEWDWNRTLEVNLSGAFFTMQSVGRIMRQQGGGVIVNIAASMGLAQILENRAAFMASKMGLIGLTRQAARELAAYNIRVNAVCPGGIADGRWPEDLGVQDIPLARLGAAQDAADVVLFLSSPAAAFITGQAINVDGGLSVC